MPQNPFAGCCSKKKRGPRHRNGEKVDDRQNNCWETNKKTRPEVRGQIQKKKNAGDKKKVRGVICT